MDYTGTIIEESLQDTLVLNDMKITTTKKVPTTEQHQTPWVQQWTLHEVVIPESEADQIAERLSHSIDVGDKGSWYADFINENYHYIIYRDKVFKVDLHNPILYQEVKEYGASTGIPAHQLDFEK